MSNVISNQNKLTALEFQFVSLKQKLKNDGILVENNKEYRRLQIAVSRCKKAIQVEETYLSENNVEKVPSPLNVVGVHTKFQKKKFTKNTKKFVSYKCCGVTRKNKFTGS